MPELAIDPDKVCYIIVRLRQLHAKVAPVEPDPASNETDDGFREVLEDYADDPVAIEIRQFIEGMDEDELSSLVALMWVGRGDFSLDEWNDALAEAGMRADTPTAEYLMGTPLAADLLEEGLSAFGKSCIDFEEGRL